MTAPVKLLSIFGTLWVPQISLRRSVINTAVNITAIFCFILLALRFASLQNIWIDETTQMSGIDLLPKDILVWLMGKNPGRFGVPGDRMPPISYLVDSAWSHFATKAELPFRMFHAMLVIIGLVITSSIERTLIGARFFSIALIFLVLSPKMLEAAVELRAYPLFFLITCIQILTFTKIISKRDLNDNLTICIFTMMCIIASYTHFFGIVSSSAFFCALILEKLYEKEICYRRILFFASFLLCCLGILPFATASSGISTPNNYATLPSIMRYLPTLVGGSANLVEPLSAALFFGGCAALISAAIIGAVARMLRTAPHRLDWLLVVAALGVVATIITALLVHSFDPLKPSYSLWLMPVFALIIANGAAQRCHFKAWDRFGRFAAMAATLIGGGMATTLFGTHGDWFIHGPSQAIIRSYNRAPGPVGVVYLTAAYADGYFPLAYATKGNAEQWLADDHGLRRVLAGGGPATLNLPFSVLTKYHDLVLVSIVPRHFDDFKHCLDRSCPVIPQSPATDALLQTGSWDLNRDQRIFGYYDARIIELKVRYQ